MKKTILKSVSVFLAFVILAAQTQTLSAKTIETTVLNVEEGSFILNQDALDVAFAELNVLDNYLASNEGTTYADLKADGSTLITNISDLSAPLGLPQEGELPLGIPAFWWGCILGWVGLLVVYLVTDKDKEQTKKALTGCLISSGVYVVFVVVYYVLIAGELNSL